MIVFLLCFALYMPLNLLCFGPLNWLFGKLFITPAKVNAYQAIQQGSRNPLEVVDYSWRMIAMSICAGYSLAVPILSPWVVMYILAEYLCAVTPLHPSEVEKQRHEREARHPQLAITRA